MLKRFATSVLIEPDRWIGFNEVEVHLVAQQLPDIAYPIPISVSVLFKIEARWNSLDHCRPFQAQAPPIHSHVFWQPHRLQHLRSEHTAVTNLNPLIQARMEAEDLQTRLCIRVIGWLEAQVVDAHLLEEDFHKANQAAKRESVICDDAFNLVEFSKMSLIDSLISKDAVDGEVASWTGIKRELVEHVR
jgi:hypothetical protein